MLSEEQKEIECRIIHYWLRRIYGAANKCENGSCKGISRDHEWAKITDKEYEFKRENFKMLCVACHRKYDAHLHIKNKNPLTRDCKSAHAVRIFRNSLSLEMEELAKELGLTKTAIYNYEIGLRKPKLSIIKRMKDLATAKNIELSIDDFLN